MTRTAKLYANMLANPRASIPFRDFERLLLALGFELDRVVGSHRQYKHSRATRILSVQPRGKDAKSYQIKQLFDMIEEFGLTMDKQ